jgi:hypothetical protein
MHRLVIAPRQRGGLPTAATPRGATRPRREARTDQHVPGADTPCGAVPGLTRNGGGRTPARRPRAHSPAAGKPAAKLHIPCRCWVLQKESEEEENGHAAPLLARPRPNCASRSLAQPSPASTIWTPRSPRPVTVRLAEPWQQAKDRVPRPATATSP